MAQILTKPRTVFWLGLALAVGGIVLVSFEQRVDTLGVVSYGARVAHIGGVIVWIGLVWFVNFVQLAALQSADDGVRGFLVDHVVWPVAVAFRMASHLTILSGLALMVTSGYFLDRWVFPSAVYIPTARGVAMWGGAIAGLVMWVIVHRLISPALGIVMDKGRSPAEKAAARQRVLVGARANLLLSIPVVLAMIAAAHLY